MMNQTQQDQACGPVQLQGFQQPSKLGRAVYLLVQWSREARARQAQQQQAQADGKSKMDK
jgi:hypothetical protein